MYLRETDERGEFERPRFPSFSLSFSFSLYTLLREVSTVGFSKARRAKVPPFRHDGNTFVFSDFKNSIVAREARVLLGLFAPITSSSKFKKVYALHEDACGSVFLPLTDDTRDELITRESFL